MSMYYPNAKWIDLLGYIPKCIYLPILFVVGVVIIVVMSPFVLVIAFLTRH